MIKLNRYIGKTVTAAILLVLAVIIGIDVLAELINQLERLRGDYTFLKALSYVLLSVPSAIHEYLPAAALIGCLAGLGLLAGSSELVVMRAAGVSTLQLIWAAMKPALVLALMGVALAEYVAPQTQQIAEAQRSMALYNAWEGSSEFGMWHRESDRFIYLSAVQPRGVIHGVTMYEFGPERELKSSLYAERATYTGDHWLLEDVVEAEFTPERAYQHAHATRDWDTDLTPEVLNLLVLDPDKLAISDLWKYASFQSEQGQRASEYHLEFWNKLLQPLIILALVLVAISFVFGPLRQVTMGFRVFVGVMVGILFQLLQDMLGPTSLVYGFPPVLASVLPIALCVAVGAGLLMRRV